MEYRVVFFGTEQFAVKILECLLLDHRFEIVAVVTQPARPVGRDQKISESPVFSIASERGIKIFTPQTLKDEDIQKKLLDCNAAVFVVAQYGLIIPQKILDIPSNGAVNVHASLLPYYRGATPVHAALLAGEKETGVSFMRMDAQMDHGPLFSRYTVAIEPSDTTEILLDKLAKISTEHFPDDLDALLTKKISCLEQDHEKATLTKIISREDGYIDWTTMDALHIERMTRAFYGWPGVTIQVENTFLKIITARVINSDTSCKPGLLHINKNSVQIETVRGVLEILSIQPAGKKVLTAEQFAQGYKKFDGLICQNITKKIS